MLYTDVLTVDYGPEFLGQALKVDQGIVCVVPSHLNGRSAQAPAMREMVGDLGGNCRDCRRCPVGRDD